MNKISLLGVRNGDLLPSKLQTIENYHLNLIDGCLILILKDCRNEFESDIFSTEPFQLEFTEIEEIPLFRFTQRPLGISFMTTYHIEEYPHSTLVLKKMPVSMFSVLFCDNDSKVCSIKESKLPLEMSRKITDCFMNLESSKYHNAETMDYEFNKIMML